MAENEPNENEELPDFFAENAFEAVNEILNEDVDENVEYATLIPTGGRRIVLPITRGEDGELVQQSIVDAAEAANVTIPQSTQFYVEGNAVEGGTIITPGMRVTAVGNVKGGK